MPQTQVGGVEGALSPVAIETVNTTDAAPLAGAAGTVSDNQILSTSNEEQDNSNENPVSNIINETEQTRPEEAADAEDPSDMPALEAVLEETQPDVELVTGEELLEGDELPEEEELLESEEIEALNAPLAEWPASVTSVTIETFDTLYAHGTNGYGFSFALLNNNEFSYNEWDTSDIRIQIDGGNTYQYSMPTDKTPNILGGINNYILFGGMYLDNALSTGNHTLKIAVYTTKGSKWYAGQLSVNLVRESGDQIISFDTNRPDAFNPSKGSKIRMIRGYFNSNRTSEEFSSLSIVPHSGGTPIVSLTSGVSIGPASDQYDAHYSNWHGWIGVDFSYTTIGYGLNHEMPNDGAVYSFSVEQSEITLSNDVAEGFYDLVIETKSGTRAVLENRYLATGKPVIYDIGYRKNNYSGDLATANRGSDYIAAYVYGVNLSDSIYPVYYQGGTAVSTYAGGKRQPLFAGWPAEWGYVYQLDKTDAAVWDSASDTLTLDLKLNLAESDTVDARKVKTNTVSIPNGPVYAFGNTSRYETGGWMAYEYNKVYTQVRADWIKGATEVGIVRYADEEKRAARSEGTDYKARAVLNDRGDIALVTDDIIYGGISRYNKYSVYRVVGGSRDYIDLEYSDAGSSGYLQLSAATMVDGAAQHFPESGYYEIHELDEIRPITSFTGTNTKSVDSQVPKADQWKLLPEGIYRVFIYDKKEGQLRSKTYVTGFSGAAVPASAVTIELSDTDVTLEVGDLHPITAIVRPAVLKDKTVTWTSNNKKVAEVSADGTITAKGIGAATITATTKSGSKKATCKVNVIGKIIPVTGIALKEVNEDGSLTDLTSKEITVGEYVRVRAELAPADTTETVVVWESSDDTIASVEGDTIVAKAEGTATITASVTSRKTGNTYTATCSVTGTKAVTPVNSVSFDQTAAQMRVGDKITLTATTNPEDAGFQPSSVIWQTYTDAVDITNPDSNNLFKAEVTAVEPGITTVRIQFKDMTGSQKTAQCIITVDPVETSKTDGGDDDYDDTDTYAGLTDEQKQELWIAPIAAVTYNGKKQTPKVRVYNGTKLLKEKTDYTLSWKNNQNAEEEGATAVKGKTTVSIAPQVTVKFKGDYSGTLTKEFTINKVDIGATIPSSAADYTADNNITTPAVAYKAGQKFSVLSPVVTVNGKKLGKNDYTLKYKKGSGEFAATDIIPSPDTYTITIEGKGNYEGTREIEGHAIDPKAATGKHILMSAVTVSKLPAKPYMAGGVELIPGNGTKPGSGEDFVVTYKSGGEVNAMTKNVDYTVSYHNNDKVGTATLILRGEGTANSDGVTFYGEKRLTFKINGTPLSKVKIPSNADLTKMTYLNGGYEYNEARKGFVYNGKAFDLAGPAGDAADEGDIKLKDTTRGTEYELQRGTDYTVTYQKNVNAGTATIIFTGINGYTGIVKRTFRIVPEMLFGTMYDKIVIPGVNPADEIDEVTYQKGGVKPAHRVQFTDRKDQAKKITLIQGADYTSSYTNNSKLSIKSDKKAPTITIKGKGNFTGTLTKQFSIVQQDLKELSISAPDKAFSTKKGNWWMSTPVITDVNGKTLTAGTDYEKLTAADYSYYGKNWGAMPAEGAKITVTVKGKGAYQGTISTTYRIYKNDINKATITIEPQTYTGRTITLKAEDFVEGKTVFGRPAQKLTLGTDFEIVSYQNNIRKGRATVVIRGKGDFGGTKKVSFQINAKAPK